MTKKWIFPALPGAIFIVFATIVATFLIGFLLHRIGPIIGLRLSETSLLGITNTLSIGAVALAGWYFTKRPFREVFSVRKASVPESLTVVLTCIGWTITISEIDNLFSLVLPKPDFILEMLNRLFSDEDLLGTSIALMVVAPFTEEFLFRGLIWSGLRGNYSFIKAALWTSLLFGILHLNPWQFIGAGIVGFYFAWLLEKTGSLAQPILAHMVFNGFPIFVKFGLGIQIVGYTGESMQNGLLQPFWLDCMGITITIVGIATSIFLFRKRENRISHFSTNDL
ncbi:CPBP family intramembrane metalloprotease [Leptospira fluminis]|uniref:CPBP family intramembrane metalloprotease n=1 Tax=Leptospira fluminis TaxID=2484979 RepID=A0A4R9GLH0_9LEPT|nr:type II CAAX endopeptidase family protein [Leptospira fluminis]TGK15596.1 CPBP family intramembrane metalloprotease [Leptospira fluminis]